MSSKIKLIIGIVLIFLSVALMFLWETRGRDYFMNEEVIVSTENIEAGQILSSNKIRIANVPKDAVSENCLTPENLNDYLGKSLKYGVNLNSQISVDSFIYGENPVTDDMSLFKIESSWIKNLSSSARSGDNITIQAHLSGMQTVNLGTYYAAFVKDSSGRELVESTGSYQPEIIKRTTGLYVPSYLEIAAKLSDYTTIISYVDQGYKLIIMQEGVSGLEY